MRSAIVFCLGLSLLSLGTGCAYQRFCRRPDGYPLPPEDKCFECEEGGACGDPGCGACGVGHGGLAAAIASRRWPPFTAPPRGPLEHFRGAVTCRQGCGAVYLDEWLSDPPDCNDPCDDGGCWIGPQCPPRLGQGLRTLFGFRHGDGACRAGHAVAGGPFVGAGFAEGSFAAGGDCPTCHGGGEGLDGGALTLPEFGPTPASPSAPGGGLDLPPMPPAPRIPPEPGKEASHEQWRPAPVARRPLHQPSPGAPALR